MPELDDYLTVRDAAIELNLSPHTIYAYLNMGEIEGAFKFAGTRWMIPRQWIDDYLNGNVDMAGAWNDWRKRCQKKSSKKK